MTDSVDKLLKMQDATRLCDAAKILESVNIPEAQDSVKDIIAAIDHLIKRLGLEIWNA